MLRECLAGSLAPGLPSLRRQAEMQGQAKGCRWRKSFLDFDGVLFCSIEIAATRDGAASAEVVWIRLDIHVGKRIGLAYPPNRRFRSMARRRHAGQRQSFSGNASANGGNSWHQQRESASSVVEPQVKALPHRPQRSSRMDDSGAVNSVPMRCPRHRTTRYFSEAVCFGSSGGPHLARSPI